MPEFITIRMKREDYDTAKLPPHQVKEVKVIDDAFVNDERYKLLKSLADKAYRTVEEYCFKKRNGMQL